MTKFNDYVKDTGFPTETLENLLKVKFEPAITEILEIAGSDNEVRILASIMSNRVGKLGTDAIVECSAEKKTDALTDFIKYGEDNEVEQIKNKFIDPFELIFDKEVTK